MVEKIKVRATQTGQYGRKLRKEGDVFTIDADAFSKRWMVPVTDTEVKTLEALQERALKTPEINPFKRTTNLVGVGLKETVDVPIDPKDPAAANVSPKQEKAAQAKQEREAKEALETAEKARAAAEAEKAKDADAGTTGTAPIVDAGSGEGTDQGETSSSSDGSESGESATGEGTDGAQGDETPAEGAPISAPRRRRSRGA